MRCGVSLDRDASGIVARCREYPACEGRGATAEEALARLRASLLFWLEACPCDTTTDTGLVLDVENDGTRRA
jgi:predicted RNase H-like HicB family nuclease